MLKFEYIDTIRYEAGKPRAVFLLTDVNSFEGKRVAVFGTGIEAFITEKYLESKGIETECFINNDPQMEGRILCGKQVMTPDKIWGQGFSVIIAMSNARYINEVLWQLKVHDGQLCGVAFMETYHAFTENGKTSRLQELVVKAISRILCDDRNITDIMCPIVNVGPSGNLLFPFDELCWSTTWTHHLLQWFYEKYSTGKAAETKNMLEIGPGRGLFSAVVHDISPDMEIEWLMFDMDEKSDKAVKNRYGWWPANLFETYYGMIEEPQFRIDKKFDMIVMTEVLEHFSANPRTGLRKIADMLAEDGELYLSTPDWGHLPIYDTYHDIPDFTTVEEYRASYIGHSYQYTKDELMQLLDECGLTTEKYAVTDGGNHNVLVKHQ